MAGYVSRSVQTDDVTDRNVNFSTSRGVAGRVSRNIETGDVTYYIKGKFSGSPGVAGYVSRSVQTDDVTDRNVRFSTSRGVAGRVSRSIETGDTTYMKRNYSGSPDYRKRNQQFNRNENENDGNFLKKAGKFVFKTTAISLGIIGGISIIVPALGFGAAGITAGSVAAAFQSSVLGGTIASGSAFATLQSVGAAGLAGSTKLGIVGVSAAAAAYKKNVKKG